ncbi:hypothetical protein [Stratiformator vulcanicus]|uniref:Uncharacterized protein n=1 Tax=Stratiformator vulcanicus TaxID=2527980 RepID=A0A517R3Q6_9PLAN|nr:hypothetical protein [Stratiformator vulcanicus]QDT38529.1 hypothetical protein Pan189_29230 [Stratiformator vulcanicus]
MKSFLLSVTFAASGLLMLGCTNGTPTADTTAQQGGGHDEHGHDHDHGHDHGHADEHPETFAGAVEQLTEMRDTVKAALAENDLKKADGPVHAVGHVLEDLVSLAKKAGLSEEQQATVETAQETLFESYGALDQTIHGKESGKTWDDVGSDIDSVISSLQNLASSGGAEE